MATHDYNIANASGAAVRSDVNDVLSAIVSWNSGTSWSTTVARQRVVDTSAGIVKRRNAANSGWIAVDTDDETFVLARSSNTMLDSSDRFPKLLRVTGSYTQTLDAAATLGDGWNIPVRVESGAVLTVDPNASENIDGATTKVITGPASGWIFCNGSAFYSQGFIGAQNMLFTDATYDIGASGATRPRNGEFSGTLVVGSSVTAASLAGTAVATQSNQETGTSTTTAVSPGRQQYHPSAAKGFCKADVAGNILASYNVTSITDSGTGEVTVTWNVDFSSAEYVAVMSFEASTALAQRIKSGSQLAGSTIFQTYTVGASPALTDPSYYAVAVFGDQ